MARTEQCLPDRKSGLSGSLLCLPQFWFAESVPVFEEFKKFALGGNVVDMAVGIVIGAAFGTIVTSLVEDIIMPPVGMLLGGVDFSNVFFVLKEGASAGPYSSLAAASSAGAVTINIGNFVNTLISFLIIAAAIFLVVKLINRARSETKSVDPDPQIVLLTQIRDLLERRF